MNAWDIQIYVVAESVIILKEVITAVTGVPKDINWKAISALVMNIKYYGIYSQIINLLSDIDECLIDNGNCSYYVECTNTNGSRTCGSCPQGTQGNGTFCESIK